MRHIHAIMRLFLRALAEEALLLYDEVIRVSDVDYESSIIIKTGDMAALSAASHTPVRGSARPRELQS